MRLDSDPLQRRYPSPCTQSKDPCVDWGDIETDSMLHPTPFERLFVISTLPAFPLSSFLAFGLGNLGVSQVTTFMLSMPLATCTWLYIVGWLIDRKGFRQATRP
jgi:hypothetical protein